MKQGENIDLSSNEKSSVSQPFHAVNTLEAFKIHGNALGDFWKFYVHTKVPSQVGIPRDFD